MLAVVEAVVLVLVPEQQRLEQEQVPVWRFRHRNLVLHQQASSSQSASTGRMDHVRLRRVHLGHTR